MLFDVALRAGFASGRVVISAFEHPSIRGRRRSGWRRRAIEVTRVPPAADGVVPAAAVASPPCGRTPGWSA